MKVKICGVNSAAAFDAAAEALADWVGFVFFARSPRAVTAAEAAELSAREAGGPLRVGLFVDPSDDDIARVLDVVPLAALQLYAPVSRCMEVANRFGVAIWRAVPVASRDDLPTESGPAAWVIEPRPPAGATRPGGNAQTMDWDMLRGWPAPAPWLLAGGLTPANVGEAIARSGADAVDVSSGVETAPGIKSAALIAAFVSAARIDQAAALV